MRPNQTAEEAPVLRSVHSMIKDLLKPDMRVYWADLLVSYVVFLSLSAAAATLGLRNPVSWVVIIGAALSLYRAAVFIHEIVHFSSRSSFRTFRKAWNVLIGVPLCIPLFMYECHAEHHNWRHYGTPRDAEYIPLARMSRVSMVQILLAVPFLPFYGIVRFGLMAPAAWVMPRFRTWVWLKSSALKLDVEYEGALPKPGPQTRSWVAQEAAVFVWVWTVAVLTMVGVIPWPWLVQFYVTYAVVVALNTLRLLASHRYIGDEDGMSVLEQVQDTFNYPNRPWVDVLWAPVGLRLHALHHLSPALPYHNYQQAHDRLSAGLPADSFYHRSSVTGLFNSLRRLWVISGRRAEFTDLSAAQVLDLLERTR